MGNCMNTFSGFEIYDNEMLLFPICGSGRIVFLKDYKNIYYYDNSKSVTLIHENETEFVISFWSKETAISCFLELCKKFGL